MADVKVCDWCEKAIDGMFFHIERESAGFMLIMDMGTKQEYDIHYECIEEWGIGERYREIRKQQREAEDKERRSTFRGKWFGS